jgi:capsular polysaccharide biosynthesis protein
MSNLQPEPLFGNFTETSSRFEVARPIGGRREIIENAVVWPTSGLLKRKDGTLEIEPIWIEDHLSKCGDYASKWSHFPISRKGLHFNITLFWWQNYYHWFTDVLSRLYEVMPNLDPSLQLILPQGMLPWQTRSLELLGIPWEQCVSHHGKRPWRIEKLLYLSPVVMTGNHTSDSLLWVRNTLLMKLGVSVQQAGCRKLYLTRKGAVSRHIVNEDEYLPDLIRGGFEVVDCALLSLDEQIQLFSEAGCVVGPHGAAFTNILFAPIGTTICEIFEPGSIRQCYWSMASTLHHDYHCGIGTSIENPAGEANLRVNVADLLRSMNAAGML